jgi:hypothetical protein
MAVSARGREGWVNLHQARLKGRERFDKVASIAGARCASAGVWVIEAAAADSMATERAPDGRAAVAAQLNAGKWLGS